MTKVKEVSPVFPLDQADSREEIMDKIRDFLARAKPTHDRQLQIAISVAKVRKTQLVTWYALLQSVYLHDTFIKPSI